MRVRTCLAACKIIILFPLLSSVAVAATVVVKVTSGTVNKSQAITINNANSMASSGAVNKSTLGNPADCTMIGYAPKIDMGEVKVSIPSGNGVYYLMLETGDVPPTELCTGTNAGYTILATSVEGIGISYNDGDGASASSGKSIPATGVLRKFNKPTGSTRSNIGIGTHVAVRLWKTPLAGGRPLPYGAMQITGPTILQVVGDINGDALAAANCSGTGTEIHDGKYCVVNRIKPVSVSTTIYSGTCDFVGASKTVYMGENNISSYATAGQASEWVDASFKLRCADAWGYNTNTSNTKSLTKNKTVTLLVHPLSGAHNASHGIINLDGSGAKGVGIQLAWGDYGSLGSTPLKPVQLDIPIAGNTVSGNIKAGPYNAGGNAISCDGTIKMAARYIGTGGLLQSGSGNAKIQILANYQ